MSNVPFPYHINCAIQKNKENKERMLKGGQNGRLRTYVHMKSFTSSPEMTGKTDMGKNKALMLLENKQVF